MKLKPVDQQVVVIVGATSGIGKAAAHLFAQKGARVVAAGRSQEALDTLIDEIAIQGGTIFGVKTDVADFDQVQSLAQTAVERYGHIDTWINAAAVTIYATFERTEPEEFNQLIQINLLGQIYGAKAALPHLKEHGGALIHIGSIESRRSLPYHSAYAASKQGKIGFIDSLRLEVKKENYPISVTTILPASVNTPFFDKALTRIGVKPQPLPPVYPPEAAAEAILYAAAHPVREMIVGGAGKAFMTLQAVSPALADAVVQKIAFKGQRTEQPKTEHSQHNLYKHMEGYNTMHGSYSEMERDRSIYTLMQTRPMLVYGVAAALLIGGTLLAGRIVMARREARKNWFEKVMDRLFGGNGVVSRFSPPKTKTIKKKIENKIK